MIPIKSIGLLGCGTVGSGVIRILKDQGPLLASRAHCGFQVAKVLVRDTARPRACDVSSSLLTTRVEDILQDPEIEIVVELVGGIEPARTWIKDALDRGKDVVTANKALLAEHGSELFPWARQRGRTIACEAAIAGGVPIVAAIRQSLTANRILAIRGILNGTSNYVIAKMDREDGDLHEAIGEAQQLGYAEADPTLDLDGSDAAQKLSLLAQLAFGFAVDWKSIPRTSVTDVIPADGRLARQMGYAIRPLADAALADQDSLDCLVQPALVPLGSCLAGVMGSENAVLIFSDAVDWLLLRGPGAGQLPTASAVVADLVDTVLGRSRLTDASWPFWGRHLLPWQPDETAKGRKWYIRQDGDPNTLRDDLTTVEIEPDEVIGIVTPGGQRLAASITRPCTRQAVSRLHTALAPPSRQMAVFPVLDNLLGL